MKKPFKYLQFLTLGVFLLSSSAVLATSKQCFSPSELNDFKTLYIKLQNELNYEGKDAYLDKKYQVRLKPHGKDKAYPGREFEAALFGEYQNSLRKIGKLYQSAKFENNDSFKSNEVLVNFMKAIDDKSSESQDFISKTKIKDVIDALEEASQKKYAKSADKKFMINAGDKYLLEKLLIHAQDRVCSVSKFEATNKGTNLFKADYLNQIKNAPLNILVNTIKNAPIEKDSKIDLRESSDLMDSLIDSDVAVQSAVADNLNQLSAWVKKAKAQDPKCLAAIKNKNFASNIQANIQSCNFGHFIDTLSQDNVNNLESVLHFINANEKLLNNPVAKAETSMDELKLEGFISKTFDKLGTAIRCTQLDPANSGDKKVFIRNLPYNEGSNQFDTSGIICKSNLKILGADSCRKQFDLSSDSLGRGLEIKPKKGAAADLTFSVKDSDNCADISFQDPKTSGLAASPEQCSATLKDGSAFVWDTKNNQCNEIEIAKVSSLEQCVSLKKAGSVFNWDAQKKSCAEFSALLTDAVVKQAAQQCILQKKNGYKYNWDSSKKSCDEIPTIAGTKLESKISCDAKTAANLPYRWNANENTCESSAALSAAELKAKAACDVTPAKNGFSNSWDNQSRQCAQLEIAKVSTIEQCVALKKPGTVFNWNSDKKSCEESSALLANANLTQAAQQCIAQKKNGYVYKWNSSKKSCIEIPTNDGTKLAAKISCDAKTSAGLPFKWNTSEFMCEKSDSSEESRSPALSENDLKNPGLKNYASKPNGKAGPDLNEKNEVAAADVNEKLAKMSCEAKSSPGNTFRWNSANKNCEGGKTQSAKPIILTNEEVKSNPKNPNPPVVGSKGPIVSSSKEEVKTKPSTPPTLGSGIGNESIPLSNLPNSSANNAKLNCEAQEKEGFAYKWMPDSKKCLEQDVLVAKTNCEDQKKEGFAYKWKQDSLKCIETEVTKAQLDCETNKKEGFEYKWIPDSVKCVELDLNAKITCEEKKKEGFTFTWDSVKEICNEVPAVTTPAKLADAEDTSLADAEKKCQEDNTKWIEEENDGRPGIKWDWDGKTCVDKRPAKDDGKKVVEEATGGVEEAPSAPKRAPGRFTPINIPTRQIYLMPGMP